MRIPLNTIHWYIGIPVMAFIAARSLSAARKNQSVLNRYLGMGALFFTVCLCVYALPPLLTTNSQVLTLSTIIGDILQFFALFWVWLAVARIYAPSSVLVRRIIQIVDMVIIALGVYYSIHENFANPVTLTQLPSGTWVLNYAFSLGYQVVTAVQYLSLLLLGARFFLDGRHVKDSIQKMRLWGFAFGFLIIGGYYVSRPFLGSQDTSTSQAYVLVVGLAITGFFVGATIILNAIQAKRS